MNNANGERYNKIRLKYNLGNTLCLLIKKAKTSDFKHVIRRKTNSKEYFTLSSSDTLSILFLASSIGLVVLN